MFGRRHGAAAVLLAAGLMAGTALPAFAAQPAKSTRHAKSTVGVTIAAKTMFKPVGGNVIVFFRDGGFSSATLSGTITGAVSGDVATMLAQRFPYSKAPVPVGSPITLTGSTPVPYSFKVTPTIATRYFVKVTSTGTQVGISRVQTVYVSAGGSLGPFRNCTQRDRPVCHEKLVIFTVVPAAAYRVVSAKRLFFYFGIKLAPHSEPGPPKYLFLDTRATISKPRRISATKFATTITWSFTVNNDGYRWNWTACTKDAESKDGYGLPGHHHCGAKRLTASKIGYLG